MEAYRDQYAKLFHGGKNVVLIAISVDPDTMQAAWAREKDFPHVFASDPDGAVGTKYGAFIESRKFENRFVYVIDPSGKIAYRATPFRELVDQSYVDLGAAIDKLVP
ncbi:MAG: redoxin domain-containing protein [Gemmatimonadaceae bacterium]